MIFKLLNLKIKVLLLLQEQISNQNILTHEMKLLILSIILSKI